MSKSRILNLANMSFRAIRENKILAKISEFTVRKINLHMRSVSFIGGPWKDDSYGIS